MGYFIFGGVAWLFGLRILDPLYRAFSIVMLMFIFALLTFMWLDQAGSVRFSGVWTPAFGFYLLWMLLAGGVGLGLGILMRFPRVYKVRAD